MTMIKKKTLSEYQAAFKNLMREMEQDLGTPCNGVYIRTSKQTDWGMPIENIYSAPKRRETRIVTCEISFGDSYGLKLSEL